MTSELCNFGDFEHPVKKFHFRLNCAILNDSFIHSPSKKFDYDNTPQQKSKCKEDENNPNAQNKEQFNSESSVDSGNHSKSNHLSDEGPPTVVDENPLKISYRPIKARTQLFATKSASSLEPSIPSVFQKSHHKVLSPAEDVRSGHQHEDTPKLIESLSLKTVDIETPFKKVDPHMFATPSLRLQSFCAPTAKKSINLPLQPRTCERKEKPQAKILFTTPSARPPPGSLLESTPIEMRKPPLMNLRKLSPIKEPSTEKEKTDEKVITINNIDYIIDHKIGSGGSSTVFLARAKKSNSECAIKLVKLDGDQQVIDGYLNETKQLEKLQGNVCVVKLLDYCHLRDRGILYVVMEKGESDLHKILQGFKTHIPLYTLMSYWYQMLQAVNYIHLNGVIHSDLKPANFLMIDGRLKLIDFGIASNIAIDSTSIIKFSQAGTFNYISPEALIDTSNGDSPSTHHQPKIRLSTKSDVSFENLNHRFKIKSFSF